MPIKPYACIWIQTIQKPAPKVSQNDELEERAFNRTIAHQISAPAGHVTRTNPLNQSQFSPRGLGVQQNAKAQPWAKVSYSILVAN